MNKKLIFIYLLFSFSLLKAEIVNSVVAIVENEPITNYEIYKIMKNTGANQKDALEILIQDKLQTAQIKKQGIVVSPYEVDIRIQAIAQQNRMSLEEFKDTVEKNEGSYTAFKQKIQKELQQEKLFNSLFNDINKKITPENVRRFYETHPELFTVFDSVNTTIYTSENKNSLELIKSNPNTKPRDVKTTKGVLKSTELNSGLVYIFANTPEGKFSPIIPSKKGYSMFFVTSKSNTRLMDFESSQEAAINAFVQSQRQKAVQDYNERVRTNANIQILQR